MSILMALGRSAILNNILGVVLNNVLSTGGCGFRAESNTSW